LVILAAFAAFKSLGLPIGNLWLCWKAKNLIMHPPKFLTETLEVCNYCCQQSSSTVAECSITNWTGVIWAHFMSKLGCLQCVCGCSEYSRHSFFLHSC